jgi:TRAP-type C4-dicarboxylate transport system permease small subunit
VHAIAARITALNRVLATWAGLLTALITVIVCVDVASRGLLNRSIQGASEFVVLLLVALVFLGFAGAEAKGENFSVTILVHALKPRTQRLLKIVTNLISLAAVGLLAWTSWSRAIAATQAGEESYGTIAFPVWPSRLLIAFGLTMLALQLIAGLLDILAGEEAGGTA